MQKDKVQERKYSEVKRCDFNIKRNRRDIKTKKHPCHSQKTARVFIYEIMSKTTL